MVLNFVSFLRYGTLFYIFARLTLYFMKKITYLFLLFISCLAQGQTCIQNFYDYGYDDEGLSLTVAAADLDCYSGTVNSIVISSAYLDDGWFDDCGDYYDFTLNIDGIISTVCSSDLEGKIITNFQTMTITANDLDDYSDLVGIDIYITVSYAATAVPNCDAVLTGPENNTADSVAGILSWEEATGAVEGYKISVGTTAGGTDILNLFDVGDATQYDIPGSLSSATTYYVTVVPYNMIGNATGCAEYSFLTGSPAANDDCAGAVVVTVDANYCDGVATNGSNAMATDSGLEEADCFNYGKSDVWFSFVVPATTTSVDVSTDFTGGTLVDTEIALYSGSCGTLVELDCDQDSGTTILSNGLSYNSIITDAPVTAGQTYYVRVSGYSSAARGTFCVEVATNESLSTDAFNLSGLKAYPNPVANYLNLSYSEAISEVTIYNLVGQKVLAIEINATESQIDMTSLPLGTYLVKVNTNNQIKTIKVVKQ